MNTCNRALFLDRDGVINVDIGYAHKPEQIDFVPGIFELCRKATERGYKIVIVTNQAGIGRGYYTEDDFWALMEWMKQRFAKSGSIIDAVYFCPCHPEHGIGEYKKESPNRKPEPGMFLNAKADLGIDLSRSLLVGDKESDMIAGEKAGVGTLCLLNSTKQNSRWMYIDTLEQAAELLG